MHSSPNKKQWASLVSNGLIVALVLWSMKDFFLTQGSGNMEVIGVVCFRYFTVDSNVLVAIASAAMLGANIKQIKSKDYVPPKWIQVLKFVGTVSVLVTFLTVVFFLGPTMGYAPMFAGNSLFLHLICPLLAFASFCFFDRCEILHKNLAYLGNLPTLLYGWLYLTMVILIGPDKGGWEDFYGFNIAGMWPISFIVMLVFTNFICYGLRSLHKLRINHS